MLLSRKNKLKKNILRYHRAQPSWKAYRVQRKRAGLRRGPLVNIKTPKLIVSELRLFALKITYNVLFLLLITGFLYFLFFSEWLQINNITVEGNKITDKKLILDGVEPFLHKKAFLVFPSNNLFFVPTYRIEKEILANFKRISGAEVRRSFPTSLAIKIEEKKAVLLFCSNEGCVWVDQEGIAYNKSSYAEAVANSSSDVVIVQDNSHSNLASGQLVTEPAYVSFANRLWRSFPEKIGKELIYLSTPLPSAQEIRANTKEGWMVYFDTTMDLDKSLDLLSEVLNRELKNKEGIDNSNDPNNPSGTNCLDYIDLRVVDRVFYKMKEGCSGGGESQNPETAKPENSDQPAIQEPVIQEVQSTDNSSKPANDTQKGKKDKKKKKKN